METNMKYDLLPLEEGDEDYIDHKIEEYDESVVPPDPADADESIVRERGCRAYFRHRIEDHVAARSLGG